MKQTIRKGVAYVRESTEEQDKGFSPDNQERMMQQYADKHNIRIVKWYKDLISGTKASKRVDFQKIITDAKEQKFDIILIFHTSRFARNVKEARKYKELLRQQLNIDVISVTQPFGDWNNPSAFLNEGVNELFDEYYSKQLSFWVRSSLKEKRRQGKQLGNPPFGYYKKRLGYDSEKDRPIYSQKWLVNKKEADIVKKIFKMYSMGKYSYADIASKLNKLGLKTKYNNVFTYTSIKGILNNQTYLGFVYSPRKNLKTFKGVHPAIISKKLFDKVHNVIAERRNTIGRPVAQYRFYLLQGLVYCYHCFKHLKGKENNPKARLLPKMYCQALKDRKKNKEYLSYGCKFKRENKSCKQPNVKCETIDDQVIDYMRGFKIPKEITERTMERLHSLFEQNRGLSDNENQVKRLKLKKGRLNTMYENDEEYSEEKYLSKLKEINEELSKYDKVGLIGGNSKSIERMYIKKTEKFLNDFNILWEKIDDREKRAWIQMTIKRIWVKDKDVVAIEPRDDFKPLFVSHRKVLVQPPLGTPRKRLYLEAFF